MKKLVALFVVALLVGPVGIISAQAGRSRGEGDSRVGWAADTRAASRIFAGTEKGRRALAAAEAAGASIDGSRGQSVRADFDDDGRQDLAIGVPDEDYSANGDGVVQVLYGTANGLAASGNELFGQSDIVGLIAEDFDGFGSVLAAGDFDGDGFADLAVGTPDEDVGFNSTGLVTIVFGSASGLDITDIQFLQQDNAGIEDTQEADDRFGSSLAAANFGNGSRTDLAVGVSGEDLDATNDGAVHVFYGIASGVDDVNDTFLGQDSSFVEDTAEDGDAFGSSLAAANFGQSSHADLAVGVPGEDVAGAVDAGAVNVLFGSSSGVTVFNDQLWHQDREGIADVAEESDGFGISLTAANFGRSAQADLAVGVYLEGISGNAEVAGAVNVIYGGSAGLTSSGDQFWHQNSAGIAESAGFLDLFGWSLAAANFGKSGQADLAIGVPFETIGSPAIGAAGVVHVLYGSSTGLKAAGDQLWHQNSTGVLGSAGASDEFGWALGAANFGKSSHADLAIGVPDDMVSGVSAGAVNVLYGGTNGLSATGDQLWHQNSSNILGVAEAGDGFGTAVR
jgi:hypothetical protein